MRIAYVTETHPPEINGVALTVARTVAFLRRRGHTVDVIRPAQDGERAGAGEAADEWRSSGWPIPVYPDLRFGLARPATLARRFVATGAQLVHVATEGPLGWAAVEAAARLGLPATSDFRTNFHQYSRYYGAGFLEPAIRSYLRRFHNRTARCFVPTRQTRDDLAAAGFERVEVVDRGVDLQRFSPAKRSPALRQAWGVDDDSPVLLHVGRIAAEKNVELALRAFAEARRFTPRVRMVVVGDGPRRPMLESHWPDVRFVGTRQGDDLAAHYASADLFVFPSQSETFGNVTLEALASGLPVVAFDLAAAAEHVTDRVNGRTVAAGDTEAFVHATTMLTMMHRALWPMRVAARRSVAAQGWDGVLQRFERHLIEAAGDPAPARVAAAFAA